MSLDSTEVPPGYRLWQTAAWFLAGGAVTSVFSASLAIRAKHAEPTEVLLVGMIVPCFTWVVQATAAMLIMSRPRWIVYWGDLGRVCLLGSAALLPAGLANFLLDGTPLWLSAANVLVSVALMAGDLFRRCRHHSTPIAWPISWCLTITVNMSLFVASSWRWW